MSELTLGTFLSPFHNLNDMLSAFVICKTNLTYQEVVGFHSKCSSFPSQFRIKFFQNINVLETQIFSYSIENNKESLQLVSPHTQCQFCLSCNITDWYTLVNTKFVKYANLYCVTKIGK
jgi:hypothetical protein